jgi:hypothetical protein
MRKGGGVEAQIHKMRNNENNYWNNKINRNHLESNLHVYKASKTENLGEMSIS